jgi:hypothetical protein
MRQKKLEVENFLKTFKQKMKIWEVLFLDQRSKNVQALLDLELTPKDRQKTLSHLEVIDFSEGPKKDQFFSGQELWVFGKSIKKKEIYIKISLGFDGNHVICISFHLAEHKMYYPLKT